MFKPITLLSANLLRDAVPVLDRDGSWEITGRHPQFELRSSGKDLPKGWIMLSFDLSIEGTLPTLCVLSVQTREMKRRVVLGNSGSLCTVVHVPDDVASIRIELTGGTGVVSISPVAVRSIGKVEAVLRILTSFLTHIGSWRKTEAAAKTALRLLRNGGVAAVVQRIIDRHLFFVGDDNSSAPFPKLSGRDLLRGYTSRLLGSFPVPTKLDLFDDTDVADATDLERGQFMWTPQPAAEVEDVWSAARYCIDLLRSRADLRQRFPDALSAGKSGAFQRWLTTDGRDLFHLSSAACDAIQQAFDAGLSDRLFQVYLLSDELRAAFPLALTPAGRRGFFCWMLIHGQKLPAVRLETIWWFFLECAEQPAAELVRTYLFTPQWQGIFPDGLTVFGRAKLAEWLIKFYKLNAGWANPSNWPITGTSAEHLRLAYSLREFWRRKHDRPFETLETAQAFLGWLTTPEAGLTGEALAWCASLDTRAVARQLIAGGVNILGHFCYASGLRTSVESVTEGLKRAGLGVSLRDIWADNSDDPHHANYIGLEFYDTTIIHIQPEPFFDISYLRGGLLERSPRTYRIGYWYWELDSIPQSWRQQAAEVDELWAATTFVVDAMKERFDLPVFQMMPGVELPSFSPRPKDYFGLPEDKFTFLFVFHMTSIMERKNPFGLIKAYRRAFGDDGRVSLVLKTSFGEKHPDLMTEMREAAAGTDITIIDAVYSQEETLSLMAASDCYVSLHRSEGFGLTMAEAMLLGKPVIATGYSGNVDFMDASNSLLVDYEVVTLNRDYLPYKAGSHWAEPSVDHAAQLMRRVYDNQTWARDLGAKAKLDLRQRMSIEASGRRMAARLAEIEANRHTRVQKCAREIGS
jgi:glycosyltransferase involved in cell wall biosynthesis